MAFDDCILVLQKALNVNLSKQQLQVLKYNYKTPVLINSCAGAGKTTLLIFSILLKVMTGQLSPLNIMGITFSRKARSNMQEKYKTAIKRIKDMGLYTSDKVPYFTTFHALFYHLLKKVESVRVLPSYTHIMLTLLHALLRQSQFKSSSEIIRLIFQLRSQLINRGYSQDGLHFPHYKDNIATIKRDSMYLGNSYTNDFYVNYVSVINTYQSYKRMNHLIDFNDMKVVLYKKLQHPRESKIIRKWLSHFKICFIDEFQDIDNMQWKLVRTLLPQQAMNHLVAIGDDDQSIYGFRGSNPQIIVNFQKVIKNAKRFNLTMNFRTGGKILASVRSLIEENQCRLKKPLDAKHAQQGVIKCFKHGKKDSGTLMFNDLLKKLKDPKIDNQKIAILTRYNMDRILAIDRLADHHYYVEMKDSGDILQDNYLYKMFYDLMEALYFNNFKLFYRHARRIGFSRYRRHIQEVTYGHYPKMLTEYLALVQKWHVRQQHWNYQLRRDRYSYRDDKNIVQAFKNLSYTSDVLSQGQILLQCVDLLTGFYFKFMIEHQLISKNLYDSIHDYLMAKLGNVKDLKEIKAFFKNERHKRNELEDYHHSNSINVITIHQSKGLQFDYVYLYNLSDHDVNNFMVTLNKYFSPRETQVSFIRKLFAIKPQVLNKLGKQEGLKMANLVKSIKKAAKKFSPKFNRDNRYLRQMGFHAIDVITTDLACNRLYPQNIQKQFNQMYKLVTCCSEDVENERRLIYVAFTRAIKGAYFNLRLTNSNPLLKELKVPSEDIIK